jgi:ElaB/YqjD/DUF883 family membrane-anchored ribosome-binding protein
MAEQTIPRTPVKEGYGAPEFREKAEDAKSELSRAARELRDTAGHVKGDVRDMAGALGAMAREQTEPIEDYVRNNPIRALLYAAGVGALIGIVFRRR